MSETDESKKLLASMDEDISHDDDSFAAMQQMMGFSSFGGPLKPKRQPRNPGPGRGFGTGANSQPIHPRTTSNPKPTPKTNATSQTSPLSATSHPFVPASLPPRPPKRSSKTPPPSQTQDEAYFKQLDPIQATASPSSATSASTMTATNPPTYEPITQEATTTFIPPAFDSTAHATSNLDDIGYTNPKTGFSMTRRDLMAYERGVMEQVMNNDGSISQVKVYFKPNFVEDNPWAELEMKTGLKRPRIDAE